jgi:hypothetical protein
MAELIECIESLQKRLEKHRNTDIKEYPTRTIFIDPLLLALGWDVENSDDIQLEYTTIAGKFVDYAAKINNKAVLFIEAKALDDPLTDVKAIAQVVEYAANDGIEWCILTNGKKYKVYRTREKGTAPEKILFEVSLDSTGNDGITNQQVAECLLRVSKNAIANGILDKYAEDIFTKGKVKKALDAMFQNPPKAVIRELRNTIGDESIKASQVQKIIGEIWVEINNSQNHSVSLTNAGVVVPQTTAIASSDEKINLIVDEKVRALCKEAIDQMKQYGIETLPLKGAWLSFRYKNKQFMYLACWRKFFVIQIKIDGKWSQRIRIATKKDWEETYNTKILPTCEKIEKSK